MACAARPGGSQRSHLSIPAKVAAVILPSAAILGTTWAKASYRAKIGMTRNAARSLPRRDRSSPAMAVVTNRASVMQNSTSSSTASSAIEHAECPLGQPDGHAEQADHVGQRPGAGGRGGQQADGERAGAQRVQGQRGRVQGAVEAEREQRQDQPAEREHGEDGGGLVDRRALAAQRRQDRERADRDQHGEDRADDEGDLGPAGRAQRVRQQAELQLDEEPSHDSPSPRWPSSRPGR